MGRLNVADTIPFVFLELRRVQRARTCSPICRWTRNKHITPLRRELPGCDCRVCASRRSWSSLVRSLAGEPTDRRKERASWCVSRRRQPSTWTSAIATRRDGVARRNFLRASTGNFRTRVRAARYARNPPVCSERRPTEFSGKSWRMDGVGKKPSRWRTYSAVTASCVGRFCLINPALAPCPL